jgi:hypothetical protein
LPSGNACFGWFDRVKGSTCAGSLSDLDRHIEKLLAGDGEKED